MFVVIGPLNAHMLTETSLERYNKVRRSVEKWLKEEGVPFFTVAVLPSRYYADASHPLSEGYAQIARALLQDKRFQEWMSEYRRDDK